MFIVIQLWPISTRDLIRMIVSQMMADDIAKTQSWKQSRQE